MTWDWVPWGVVLVGVLLGAFLLGERRGYQRRQREVRRAIPKTLGPTRKWPPA